jgi:hypothetical protein
LNGNRNRLLPDPFWDLVEPFLLPRRPQGGRDGLRVSRANQLHLSQVLPYGSDGGHSDRHRRCCSFTSSCPSFQVVGLQVDGERSIRVVLQVLGIAPDDIAIERIRDGVGVGTSHNGLRSWERERNARPAHRSKSRADDVTVRDGG